MKKSILIIALLLIATAALAQPPVSSNDFGPQINALKQSLQDLKEAQEFQKRELDLRLRESEGKTQYQVWGIGFAILLAFASGPLAALMRSKLDKKILQEAAAEKAKEEINTTFPAMAAELMKSFLDKEIPRRVDAILKVSDKHRDDEDLMITTKIVVIADTEEVAKARAQFLREAGFKNVTTSLPIAIEDLGPLDICFVEHPGPEGDYKTLTNKYLESVIESVQKSHEIGLFTFAPFHFQQLDYGILKQKGFANQDSKIKGNLFQLISLIKK